MRHKRGQPYATSEKVLWHIAVPRILPIWAVCGWFERCDSMRKRTAISIALLISVLLTQLSGCKGGQAPSGFENAVSKSGTVAADSNFVYGQRIIDASGLNLNCLEIAENGYYLYGSENGELAFFYTDLDFSSFNKINYNTDAMLMLNCMNVNSFGNLCILEYKESGTSTDIEQICHFKEFDKSGSVLKDIDLSFLYDVTNTIITACLISDSGNILINCIDKIILLDENGKIISERKTNNIPKRTVKSADGDLLICSPDEKGYIIELCDWNTLEVKKSTVIDYNFTAAFDGKLYDVYFADANNLYGYDFKSETVTTILNWVDCGLSGINNITALDNESFITFVMGKPIILEKQEIDGEVTNLTLATFNMSMELRDDVVHFNGANRKYKITVNDYLVYNTAENDTAGLLRLNTEIIAGTLPDILDLSQLPVQKFAAIGLLADLTPYMSNIMPELLENIVKSADIKGGIYEFIPAFAVLSVIGSPKVIGDKPAWDLNEFYNTIEKNNQFESVFGKSVTSYDFLRYIVAFNSDEFINWEEKKRNFQTEEFYRLLKYASTYPSQNSAGAGSIIAYLDDWDDVYSGKQMLMVDWIYSLGSTLTYSGLFQNNYTFKGFPTSSGSGSVGIPYLSLGMSSVSVNKDDSHPIL